MVMINVFTRTSHRDRRRAVKELMTLRAKVKEQQRLLGVGAAFKEAASAKVREIQAKAKAAVDAQCQAQDELEAAWDANIKYKGVRENNYTARR